MHQKYQRWLRCRYLHLTLSCLFRTAVKRRNKSMSIMGEAVLIAWWTPWNPLPFRCWQIGKSFHDKNRLAEQRRKAMKLLPPCRPVGSPIDFIGPSNRSKVIDEALFVWVTWDINEVERSWWFILSDWHFFMWLFCSPKGHCMTKWLSNPFIWGFWNSVLRRAIHVGLLYRAFLSTVSCHVGAVATQCYRRLEFSMGVLAYFFSGHRIVFKHRYWHTRQTIYSTRFGVRVCLLLLWFKNFQHPQHSPKI